MAEMLDISLALEQAGGNADLARELFQMLLNELPALRNSINSAFSGSDSQLLWDSTHKLYGSTAYCGVPALRDTAKALEDAIKQEADDIENRIQAINGAIDQLIEHGPAALEQDWG